jgi:hypothetical protein
MFAPLSKITVFLFRLDDETDSTTMDLLVLSTVIGSDDTELSTKIGTERVTKAYPSDVSLMPSSNELVSTVVVTATRLLDSSLGCGHLGLIWPNSPQL